MRRLRVVRFVYAYMPAFLTCICVSPSRVALRYMVELPVGVADAGIASVELCQKAVADAKTNAAEKSAINPTASAKKESYIVRRGRLVQSRIVVRF